MTRLVYILLAINAEAEGVEAIGPFATADAAEEFADGQGGDWRLVEVMSPADDND